MKRLKKSSFINYFSTLFSAINNKFNKKVLDLHNMYRKKHQVEQELTLDEEVSSFY